MKQVLFKVSASIEDDKLRKEVSKRKLSFEQRRVWMVQPSLFRDGYQL